MSDPERVKSRQSEFPDLPTPPRSPCRSTVGGMPNSQDLAATGYFDFEILTRTDEGSTQTAVLFGETHTNTKAAYEAGAELAEEFSVRGLEGAKGNKFEDAVFGFGQRVAKRRPTRASYSHTSGARYPLGTRLPRGAKYSFNALGFFVAETSRWPTTLPRPSRTMPARRCWRWLGAPTSVV